jgi:phosphoserine aminotransferase
MFVRNKARASGVLNRAVRAFSTEVSQLPDIDVDVARAINLSAGCAALPLPVLEKAQKEFVQFRGRDRQPRGLSVTEMGYRTKDFYELMHDAESSFRELLSIPDTHEVHFFNGGATLQFAALPMNLLGKTGNYATQDRSGGVYKVANYVRNGHWSEKARDEARMFCHVHEVNNDPTDLYFSVPDGKDWNIDPRGAYIHYTAADTRQGFEFQEFPYEAIPEGMLLCCDASANLGNKPIDVSKYAVLYAAAHKNFSTSGVCYTIIRKDLITPDVLPGTPTMCNWNRFQTAPGKVWTVPVVFSVWLGKLTTEWMLECGGLPYFEDLAIRRSRLLYDFIDDSNGFYRTFVTEDKFRSRMQVVFTIRDGEGKNADLVENFLKEAEYDLGWLDIRSHPLGISSEAIRVTMYNPQTEQTVLSVREFMHEFMKRHA